MAIFNLDNEQRKRLISIIAEYANVGNERQREYFLENTDLKSKAPRVAEIRLEGSATEFATEVILKCKAWGELQSTRQSALVLVLQYLRNEVVNGHADKANFLDGLLASFSPKLQKLVDSEYLIPPSAEQQRLINIMLDISISPPLRAEAGRELSRIGDPRRGVGLLQNGIPDIVWCEILGKDAERLPNPSGGDVTSKNNSVSTKHVALDTYWMAKYPTTYAQYNAFVNDDDYENLKWWHGLQKYNKGKQIFQFSNHPCDNVTWDDAVAYCRWLSAKLNKNVRLPAQEEWEKAARGPLGLHYPWGNEYESGRANINETGLKVGPFVFVKRGGDLYLKTSTTVGLYPHGASPHKLMDMSGNVAEWTLDARSETPSEILVYAVAMFFETLGVNKIFGVEKGHVLRGGAWYSSPYEALATSRESDKSADWSHGCGFRVCTSSNPNS